jgi:broad specificity phosphatase PhoE
MSGNAMLPLTTDGEIALNKLLDDIKEPITALYAFRGNEVCEQTARLVARRFGLRIRNNDMLAPVSAGLWQGLTHEELRFRFPSIFPQWEENPLSVNPPEGEAIADAVERFRAALKKILPRNREGHVALVLRPMGLQIVKGLLRGENLPTIATHLHGKAGLERIEVEEGKHENVKYET